MKSWVPKRVPVCSPSPAPDYKHDLCEYGIMPSVVNYNVFDQVQEGLLLSFGRTS